MEITWHGNACFTLKTKQGTALIDPQTSPSAKSLQKADIILASQDGETEKTLEKSTPDGAKLISWPGEYEVKSMAITAQEMRYQKEEAGKKTDNGLFFMVDVDGLRICYLGPINAVPSDELIESIGDVDILMLPVGGGDVLDASGAHEVIEEIEPRAVIPMCYAAEGLKGTYDGIEPFLKKAGAQATEIKDKFNINNRSDLAEDKLECIVLKPQLEN